MLAYGAAEPFDYGKEVHAAEVTIDKIASDSAGQTVDCDLDIGNEFGKVGLVTGLPALHQMGETILATAWRIFKQRLDDSLTLMECWASKAISLG